MSSVQRVAKNVFSLFTGHLISQLLGFCVIVYVARKLGANQFGVLVFTAAFVSYFKLLTDWGVTTLAIRDIAREKRLTQEYAGSITVIGLFFSVIAFLILFIITKLLHFSQLKNQLILLYGIAFFPTVLNLSWVFNAHEKMEYQGLLQVVGAIFYFIGAFLFLYYLPSAIVIPLAYIASSLIVSLISLLLFLRFFGKPRLKIDLNYWKNFIISALPFGASLIATLIYYNFDTIMLSFMKGDTVVGRYNAAYKIIFVLLALVTFYAQAIFPIFSQRSKVYLAELSSIFRQSVKLIVVVSIPLVVGGMMLAPVLISTFFGAEYANAIPAFQILICSITFAYLGRIYYTGLLSCEKQSIYLRIVILSAAINLVLNFILIPPFSLYGAAIATLTTEALSFLMCYQVFQKVSKVPILKYISKPLIASAFMGAILYLARSWNLFFSTTLGIIIYFTFLFLIKGITVEEIKKVKTVFSKENYHPKPDSFLN